MLSNQDNDNDEAARSRAEGDESVHENLVFEPVRQDLPIKSWCSPFSRLY